MSLPIDPRRAVAAGLLLCAGAALAQPVYKCEVAGKATYQSEPCATGKASAVTIIGGPSAEDTAAARQRALRDKQDAAILSAPPAPPPGQRQYPTSTMRRGPADCAAMNAQRERAYSQRNAALNGARRGVGGVTAGSRQDVAIGSMNIDIENLESTMRARGCTLN